jgi:glycosyltransferase involved in cell wall biosynthesis
MVVGDFYRFKGVEMVIRALAALEPTRRPLVLLCGRPLQRDYVQMLLEEAGSLGVADRLRLMGSLDHRRLMSLLGHSRACITPSRFENLSRVPSEAMAAGSPVVSSDIPSFREACGDAALFFQLDDVVGLARHITILLEDETLRETMIARGYAHLADADQSDASAQLLAALERLAGS